MTAAIGMIYLDKFKVLHLGNLAIAHRFRHVEDFVRTWDKWIVCLVGVFPAWPIHIVSKIHAIGCPQIYTRLQMSQLITDTLSYLLSTFSTK